MGCAGVFAADPADYDTAWTFVYDGGKGKDGDAIPDAFRDVKALANGDIALAGETRDSNRVPNALMVELSPAGGVVREKRLWSQGGIGAEALEVSRKGGFIVGGNRFGSPLLMKLDAGFEVKSSAWFYDSAANRLSLARGAVVNSVAERSDGRIAAAAGDVFPDNNGQTHNNYAAYLEFDPAAARTRVNEWLDVAGYDVAGWSIVPDGSNGWFLGGYQALFGLDTAGNIRSKTGYPFSLPGVGTESNKVSRVRRLRDGSLMAAGQSYEEDCWTRYQRLYYDAWWSPLSGSGHDDSRYTAGVSGADDYLSDFAQLADGRLAFVGEKGTAADSGIWVFVTDSTGKTLEWQRQYDLPGLDQGSARNNLLPIAIAATPDSGFIVAGKEGARKQNDNAFAFKLVPKPRPASRVRARTQAPSRYARRGRVFSLAFGTRAAATLAVYDSRGGQVASYADPGREGQVEFRVDAAGWERGAYVWRMRSGGRDAQGVFAVTE